MKYRRFGRTELRIPVISSGGMRFQHSWKGSETVPDEAQERLEACVYRALDLGINHFETARGYGTSENQLGKILPKIPRNEFLLQTKVAPFPDVAVFEKAFEKSMSLLNTDYLDIFSIHGINNDETLEQAIQCYELADRWRSEGRIREIGFSTHGSCVSITKAIETDLFDHVNIHWYYIFQENWPAIQAARARDMGIFIISPNDKGGLLYKPSERLCELTAPLHPMVFNGLFCLMHDDVHTLSCGISKASDFDIHMETVELLDRAEELVPPIVERLEHAMAESVGSEWASTWDIGVPEWEELPGQINAKWILRLRNLAIAYDMVEYGRMRYNMLGNGGHWFPGYKADKLDELDLSGSFNGSPNASSIRAYLEEAHELLAGEEQRRLSESET